MPPILTTELKPTPGAISSGGGVPLAARHRDNTPEPVVGVQSHMKRLQVISGYLERARVLPGVINGDGKHTPTKPANPLLLVPTRCDVANPQERIYVHVVVCKGNSLTVRSQVERHNEYGFEIQGQSVLNVVENIVIAYVLRSMSITRGFIAWGGGTREWISTCFYISSFHLRSFHWLSCNL